MNSELTLKIACLNCHAVLKAKPAWVGKNAPCPKCGQEVLIVDRTTVDKVPETTVGPVKPDRVPDTTVSSPDELGSGGAVNSS